MSVKVRAIDLWKSYEKPVIQGANFSLEAGLFMLSGNNGAGKTTLLKILAGVTPPSRGTVERPPGGAGLCLAEPALYPELSVEENLNFYARLWALKNWRKADNINFAEALELLDKMKIRTSELSTGWQKRVDIFRAVMTGANMVLLDEAFAGLDPTGQTSVISCLKEIAEKSIVIITGPERAQGPWKNLIIENGKVIAA